jgi:hypothetical protein
MERLGPVADWTDAEVYAPLLAADRSILAWEWLRRVPGYREAARRAINGEGSADCALWGLHRFEDPALGALDARPIWRADHDPYVLKARARSKARLGDAFDLSRLSTPATMAAQEGAEHWLLSDGLRSVRVDVVDGTAVRGPVELRYLLAGRASAQRPLVTLRRLLALAEQGRFSRTLHAREPRARRWILALRTHDALTAGAKQREIAAALLSDDAAEARWRINAASLRSQVQRLVRAARGFVDDGYRAFLE